MRILLGQLLFLPAIRFTNAVDRHELAAFPFLRDNYAVPKDHPEMHDVRKVPNLELL